MKLTKKEQAVYQTLCDNVTVSRESLLTIVWGVPADVAGKFNTRTVDMTVSRLKRKLPKSMTIETVRGFGYRLLIGVK